MFYEEKIINGVLMYRTTPTGDWKQCSIEKMSSELVEIRSCHQLSFKHNSELLAENDRLRKDAERLDWLLETCDAQTSFYISGNECASADELKEAIDEAMKAQEG